MGFFDSVGDALGGIAGGLLGGFSSNDDEDNERSVQQTQTNVIDPRLAPYYYGDSSRTGIFDLANTRYGEGGYSPEQLALDQRYLGELNNLTGPTRNTITGLGTPLATGRFDYSPTRINGNVNLQSSRTAQGVLNPTQPLTGLLSGQVDTSQLGALHQQAINRGAQGYDDLINRVNTEVLPGMRSEAINAGQYGGSRQGIAEGLLNQQLARNARDITQSAADVGSVENQNAFDAAKQRQFATAMGLNEQGYTAAQNNIGNLLAINEQGMNANTQNINNRVQGVNVLGAGTGMLGNLYDTQRELLSAPNDANWGNLGRYSDIVLRGAGMGGTTTGNTAQEQGDQGTNWNRVLGGALTGMQLVNSFRAPSGSSNFYNGSGAPGQTANQYWYGR